MINIIRIIPRMKLGGVEQGLLNEIKLINNVDGIKYHLFIIERSSIKISDTNKLSVIYLDAKFTHFYFIAKKINKYIKCNGLDNIVILSSLWKSHLITFFLGKYHRISFFHSSNYAHFLDRICSRLAFHLHDRSIYDSCSTRSIYDKNGTIIPYVFKVDDKPISEERNFRFVFIGRINKVKGLDRALLIIHQLKTLGVNPIFDIYGPDEGEVGKLKKLISSLGLNNNVFLKGELDPISVPCILSKYTFYLQTSYREGMGASVILSQSIGLIPIITPVGELPNYCDESNSVLVKKFDDKTIAAVAKGIINIINDDYLFYKIKKNTLIASSNYQYFDDALLKFFHSLKSDL
ncbi:glycosyltransferase family 4 protein [Edwardsiella tarda]|uniref:glycosyltransferase family 4 protein n=1 Tax=Edwardsiella tarda TaxID=636 RepID=UPI00098FB650|nr:glycosyltransferase [Edwardsiella tarda]